MELTWVRFEAIGEVMCFWESSLQSSSAYPANRSASGLNIAEEATHGKTNYHWLSVRSR